MVLAVLLAARGGKACATAQSQVRPGQQVTAEVSPGGSCAKIALGDASSTIGLDLQALIIKVATDGAAAEANIMQLKDTMEEMEHSLTSCLDDITTMKATIKTLTTDVVKLEQKCEDLEDRSRQNNIRIMGTPIVVPCRSEGAKTKSHYWIILIGHFNLSPSLIHNPIPFCSPEEANSMSRH